MPPSDRDADVDYEALKRLLLTSAVRTLRIMNMKRQGRRAKEIAAIMGMSESAVRGVVKRTKRKLAHFDGAKTPRSDPFPQNRC